MTQIANKNNLQTQLEKYKPQIQMALPEGLSPDRFIRMVLTEINGQPKLANCDRASLFCAIITCAQLGLEPGKALGHAYILPYENKKSGITTANLILGYRGMIDLARRSGKIMSISAREIYENDEFSFQYGLNESLVHKINIGQERGKIIAVYAVAQLVGGGTQFEVMSYAEIEKIRGRSKNGQYGPWVTDWAEMAKKTAIRRLFKYLPVSLEVAQAGILDEDADRGEQELIITQEQEEAMNEVLQLSDESAPVQLNVANFSDSVADKI